MRSEEGWPLFKDGMKYDAVDHAVVRVYERFCHPRALRVKEENPEVYREWRERVLEGSAMISPQQQRRHRKGSKEYRIAAGQRGKDPSYFDIGEDKLLRVVMRCAGYGFPNVSRSGGWGYTETCFSDDMDALTMYNGKPVGTHAFKIHYSQESCHAVPLWEEKYRDHGSS